MNTTKLDKSSQRPESLISRLQELWDAVNYPDLHTAWTWALFFAVLALVPAAILCTMRLIQSIVALIG